MLDFVGKRKLWYLLSLLVIIPGIMAMATQRPPLNLGIDFTGGNLLQVRFEQPVETSQVREALREFNLEQAALQPVGPNEFLLRTPVLTEEESTALLERMEEKFGSLEVQRNEKVGAVIGAELTRKGLYALALAAVLMVIYIGIRFEFLFGIAAVVALLHDVLVTVGLFALFRWEINSAFVAAILTIIGYSLNDTIVVFDRIRENLRMRKKESLEELVNKSIAQSLVRCINTMVAVALALLSLLILGGDTTKGFALALLIGSLSGTYSSIFTASPLWVDLRNLVRERKRAARAKVRRATSP
ncbi:MAG TPA: protein translocase subunit SecF [Peptococcaceae bacterium]|nr:protein translocase subunit SecF [Peptococcaceae bacterium]